MGKIVWMTDQERLDLARQYARPAEDADIHLPGRWAGGTHDDGLHFGRRSVWAGDDAGEDLDVGPEEVDEDDHGGDEEVTHPGAHTEPTPGGEDDVSSGCGAELPVKFAGMSKEQARAILRFAALKGIDWHEAVRQLNLQPPSAVPPSKAEYRRALKYSAAHGANFEDSLAAIRGGGK
jgi:hypothetical protein